MKKSLIEEKQQLQQELSQYLLEIENQKREITEEVDLYRNVLSTKYKQSVKVLSLSKTGVLVLGGLYVVYWLGSLVFGLKKPKASKAKAQVVIQEPSDSAIVRQIKASIASFLLSIAKKELLRLIKQWREGSTVA